MIGIATVIGIKSAFLHWNGLCHDFHGDEYTCTLEESVNDSLFGWYIVTCLLTPIPFFFWGIAFCRWLIPPLRLHPVISVVLTAVMAIISGVLGFYASLYFLLFLVPIIKWY
jgi:hypothetical protein